MPIVRFPSLSALTKLPQEESPAAEPNKQTAMGPRNIMDGYLKLWLRPSGVRKDTRARVPGKQGVASSADEAILSDTRED